MGDLAVIDGCAGPGGWDLAAEALGFRPLGIEWDDAACATREAAGLRTLQADVTKLDPVAVKREHFGLAPLDGMIFSPPCQAFSMAGSGAGRAAMDAYLRAIAQMGRGELVDVGKLDDECGDPRAHLVLEPLRWALALHPEWIALEQVEPVLPLWEAMARVLRDHGYSVWTGVLSSEQYGVAQTRRRAILIASRKREAVMPPPSHQRYVPPRKSAEQTMGLFDAPDPERIVRPEDRELQPWVSMAQALGWGMTERPSITMTAGEGRGGGPDPLDGGSGSRQTLRGARDRGEWLPQDLVGFPRLADTPSNRSNGSVEIDGTEYRERDLRAASEPAFVVTEKARSWLRFRATNDRPNATERDVDSPAPALAFGHNAPAWIVDTGNTRSGSREEGRARPTDEPSPPLTTRADQLEWRDDEPDTRPTHYDSRGQRDGRTRELNRLRSVDEPAPTIAGESRNDSWKLKAGTGDHEAERSADEPAPTLRFGARLNTVEWTQERPATTVSTKTDIFPPGHKVNAGDIAAGRGGQRRSGAGPVDANGDAIRGDAAIRVSLAEALVLQSFPPDYPVKGTKTKQFEQVGNAIPPLLALAVLRSVLA